MNTTQCPYCRQSVALIPIGFADRVERYQTLESAAANPLAIAALAIPPASEWQKITPLGRLEPKDVTTALYDAGASFILITAAGLAIVWAGGWPWFVAPAGGLVVAVWRYFGGLRLARSLLEVVETLTNTDLNRDGKVGKPADQVVKVEVKNKGTWQFATLPGQPAALVSLAGSVINGKTFVERTATDAGLTQDEFGTLRDIFVDRGWAVWNHPTRRQTGVTLTISGKAVLRSISAAPLPQGDAGDE